jgi:hypothetical protein
MASAGQESSDTGGETAVRAFVGDDQQALEIRNKTPRLEFLALQPLLLRFAQGNARQRPAQHRRHRHGGHHRHGDDHGEQVLAESAHREPDGGDDHLG